MNKNDMKRLLRAWLEPKNKQRIFSHAKRYSKVFRDRDPEDLIQDAWVVVSQRESFGPDDKVIWLAQDAMQNLAANHKRTQGYRRERLFSHETTAPLDDYAENEWIDESGEVFQNEEAHAHGSPSPEKAVIEKERVLIYREFLSELKTTLGRIELGIVIAGEDETFDTTELQQKLKCTRDQIYEARRTIKEKALKLRDRWAAGGRVLPGFLAMKKKKEEKS